MRIANPMAEQPMARVAFKLCILFTIPNTFIAIYIRQHGNVNLTLVISVTVCVALGLLIGLKNKKA